MNCVLQFRAHPAAGKPPSVTRPPASHERPLSGNLREPKERLVLAGLSLSRHHGAPMSTLDPKVPVTTDRYREAERVHNF